VASPESNKLSKLCPVCGFRYPRALKRCPGDGAALVEAQPQDLLLGPYRLVKLRGLGGVGGVYRAEHTKIDRTVAIKVLHRKLAHDLVAVRRFFREAQSVNTIRHPHVVQIYDVVTNQHDIYMVMEYLKGQSLAEALAQRSGTPMDVVQTVAVLEQVCGVLHATHRKNIVHRDLKPANIFLTAGEGGALDVKVLDFGMVKLNVKNDRVTRDGTTVGTPEYMAPEQVRGEKVDGRADIYSLGCIGFEMLTGRQMFTGGSFTDIMIRHLHEQPPRMRASNPRIPEALESVLQRCLIKAADRRPSNAMEVAEELCESVGRPFDSFGVFVSTVSTNGAASNPSDNETDEAPYTEEDMPSFDVSPYRSARGQIAAPKPSGQLRGLAVLAGISLLAAAGGAGLVVAVSNRDADHALQAGDLEPVLQTRIESGPQQRAKSFVPVHLQSVPPGAVIVDELGNKLGQTPYEMDWPVGSVLDVRFELDGYVSQERRLKVMVESTVAVQLRRVRHAGKPARGPALTTGPATKRETTSRTLTRRELR